ncbi:hypothetical protein EFO90_09965 [Lactiplantibacillus plantarum]|uniref:hypothetical protein n=1 Tax=Lactiplantibacillus plantarum TaxID=1590 RepID=UPI0021A8CA75|nr:hypothetical protein [Lactiplantibacillus plantarum]MCT3214679.1 hypothetical protein [Lactiplantibacillus plantarum]MCT3272323.1 hypothetical protein [Lactiplantibacillus plantarum]
MTKKAKTYRDLFIEVNERYGIQTSTSLHVDVDKVLSDEKYQECLKAYSILPAIFDDTFGRNEDA